MTYTVAQTIPTERIANMFGGSFEHNDMTASWCWGARLSGVLAGRDREFKTPEGYKWFWNPKLYEHPDFAMVLFEIEDEGEALEFGKDGKSDTPTGNVKQRVINRASLQAGIQLMAEKSPDHFADMMSENDDGITHDVFVQYVALGEVVYG